MSTQGLYRSSFAIPEECEAPLKRAIAKSGVGSLRNLLILIAREPDLAAVSLTEFVNKMGEKDAGYKRELAQLHAKYGIPMPVSAKPGSAEIDY